MMMSIIMCDGNLLFIVAQEHCYDRSSYIKRKMNSEGSLNTLPTEIYSLVWSVFLGDERRAAIEHHRCELGGTVDLESVVSFMLVNKRSKEVFYSLKGWKRVAIALYEERKRLCLVGSVKSTEMQTRIDRFLNLMRHAAPLAAKCDSNNEDHLQSIGRKRKRGTTSWMREGVWVAIEGCRFRGLLPDVGILRGIRPDDSQATIESVTDHSTKTLPTYYIRAFPRGCGDKVLVVTDTEHGADYCEEGELLLDRGREVYFIDACGKIRLARNRIVVKIDGLVGNEEMPVRAYLASQGRRHALREPTTSSSTPS